MKLLLNAICFLLLLMPFPAQAELTKEAQEDVADIEYYLNNLGSAQARFVQTTHDGTQLVGTFYLDRPGKLRFQYDPPIEDFVVADGVFIYFYDSQLQEQTNAPIGQTLADFFLREDIDLSDDVTVKSLRRGGDLLQVELVQTMDPEGGSLTLAFIEDPLTLKKWRIVDAQGLITEIELFYLKTGVTHQSGLFSYIAPQKTEPVYNE